MLYKNQTDNNKIWFFSQLILTIQDNFSILVLQHTEINFEFILFITYVKEMSQHAIISGSFRVVKFCSLRGEGRLNNGVRIKSYDYIRLDWI